MKLTTRSYYSVKAMVDLSLRPPGHLASVREIAQRQNLPAPYLEKLLIALRRAGLVTAVRGSQGGYILAKAPAQISLGQILEAVGESAALLKIVYPASSARASGERTSLQPSSTNTPAPNNAADWVTVTLWQRLHQRLQASLYSISLEELYYDARSWQAAQGEEIHFVV
ncbi:MAG: Rrf2 family transcriptional regulator [Cyanobacteria bacterium J06632_22]